MYGEMSLTSHTVFRYTDCVSFKPFVWPQAFHTHFQGAHAYIHTRTLSGILLD